MRVEREGEHCRDNYRLYDLGSDRFEQENLKNNNIDAFVDMVVWLGSITPEDAWFAVEDCE